MHVARLPVAPEKLRERRGLRREWLFGALLVATDFAAFSLFYLASLQGRHLGAMVDGRASVNLPPLLLCIVSMALVFTAASRYSLSGEIQSVRFAAEHGLACLGAFGLALLLQFSVFLSDWSRSRLALLVAFLVFTPFALLTRRLLGRVFRAGAEKRSILVVGVGAEAVKFYQACLDHGLPHVLRFVDLAGHSRDRGIDGPGSPRVEAGSWPDIARLLDEQVEAVVVAGPFPALSWPGVDGLVRIHFYHVPILTLEAFHEKYWRKIPVGKMDPLWALRQDFRLARDSSYRFFKRGLDIFFSTLGLLALAPLLGFCALAVKIGDGGPVLYSQPRLRRDRQVFRLFKFRTMLNHASGSDIYTQESDRRVTGVGRWLRRLRLDELPQLWNVLRGDMSLIGPPPPPGEAGYHWLGASELPLRPVDRGLGRKAQVRSLLHQELLPAARRGHCPEDHLRDP
jgi:lipopolysaccharide/colanic/teichoic acid biosynthesis glycosyltransferase